MTIEEIKQLQDGDWVKGGLRVRLGQVIEKTAKSGTTFWKATGEDDTGKIGFTFFHDDAASGLDHKVVEFSGQGIKYDEYQGNPGITIFSKCQIVVAEDQGSRQNQATNEDLGEPVKGQRKDPAVDGDFHKRLGSKASMYAWALLYGAELRKQSPVSMTDDQYQAMVSSLFIEACKCDLAYIAPRIDWDHFKHPTLKDTPETSQEAPPSDPEPVSEPEPEPEPTQSELKKRQEAAAKAKAELEEIDDLEEDDVPF